MEVIRKLILEMVPFLLMVGLGFPVVVILIIAAINERIRRIVLVFMLILTAIAILSAYIFLPMRPETPEEWQAIAEAIVNGAVTGIPLLLVMMFIGLVAYLIGPYVMERIQAWLHQKLRERYITRLMAQVEPRQKTFVALPGRAELLEGDSPAWVRLIGPAGSGKSMMIRDTLARLARSALTDPTRPLPVLIDLDDLPSLDLVEPRPRQLSRLQSIRMPLLDWLFIREARKRRLIFLVDSSLQTFSPLLVTPVEQKKLLDALDGMIDYFAPCPMILALPHTVSAPAIERTIQSCQALEPLSDAQVTTLLRAWLGDTAQAVRLSQSLLAGGAWETLARRPIFLHYLAQFTRSSKGRLPVDLRDLWKTVWVGNASVEPAALEKMLGGMAQQIQQEKRVAIPHPQVLAQLPDPAQARALVSSLVRDGVLRETIKRAGSTEPEACLEFSHVLFLAYFTALSWLNPTAPQAKSRALLESQTVEDLQDDPLLVETLLFFNNIAIGQNQQDANQMSTLLEQMASAAEAQGGAFRQYLVTQCLLTMPVSARPPALVARTAARLIQSFVEDEAAPRQAMTLLAPLPLAERVMIYEQALAGMDLHQLGQTLNHMVTPVPMQAPDSRDIHLLLWEAGPDIAQSVGLAWAEVNPRAAFEMFCALYEEGPADRQLLALNLLGSLPREAVEEYLYDLLKTPVPPETRIAILRALMRSGVDLIFTLLELAGNEKEPEPVRIFAARTLAENSSPELHAANVIREVVRVSHLPLPEKARRYLTELLDHLRYMQPGGVERWETVVNPYVIGRPVSDPTMLFGREKILHTLRAAVENGNHVLLHGERRIGKSSILYALLRELTEESRHLPVRAVYVDLQGLSENEFFETIMLALLEQVRERGLYSDANFPRPYTSPAFERDLAELLADLRLHLGGQMRLVLLLDEADGITTYSPANQAALRRIFTAASTAGLVVILSSSDPQRWNTPNSPFFNLFSQCPVPRLPIEDARQLITRPVAGNLQYEPAALAMIESAVQGRPYQIQAICQQLVNELLLRGEQVVTVEMVRAVLTSERGERIELLSRSENLLNGLMDWLETNPHAGNAEIEARLKQTWDGLREAMVRQVIQMKKKAG